jgi:hypothetical protein
MISAPNEMRCKSIPQICMTRKTMASTSGIEVATTKPGRRPRFRKLMTSTIAIASHSAFMNSATASSTTFG